MAIPPPHAAGPDAANGAPFKDRPAFPILLGEAGPAAGHALPSCHKVTSSTRTLTQPYLDLSLPLPQFINFRALLSIPPQNEDRDCVLEVRGRGPCG